MRSIRKLKLLSNLNYSSSFFSCRIEVALEGSLDIFPMLPAWKMKPFLLTYATTCQ